MGTEIFYWLLNMSIYGSIAGLVVLILRKIKQLPRSVVYVLWGLPLLRFWLPFGIASKYSLMSLISKYTTKTVIIWKANILNEYPEITLMNSVRAAKSYFPIEYKVNLLKNVFNTASMIWIIICCAALLTTVLLYSFTRSELKSSVHIKGNIYKSDRINSPAVYGILYPRIIIPQGIAEGDLEYILLHEQVHIEHRDNFFRMVAVITACIHWFNPLSWIFLKCFLADMELACDAKVLKSLSKTETKEYACAILASASGKSVFASAFGGAKTKVRIENILSYKKLTVLSSLFFAALTVAIAVVIITNAAV